MRVGPSASMERSSASQKFRFAKYHHVKACCITIGAAPVTFFQITFHRAQGIVFQLHQPGIVTAKGREDAAPVRFGRQCAPRSIKPALRGQRPRLRAIFILDRPCIAKQPQLEAIAVAHMKSNEFITIEKQDPIRRCNQGGACRRPLTPPIVALRQLAGRCRHV